MKLEKDLYAYLWNNPYENNCNTFLFHGEVTVLIDPGHSRHVPNLFHQMDEDGISPEEIDVVILTHCHPDHFEGLEAFMNKPVKIAMNREEERYLLESGKHLFEMMNQTLPEFRIDFILGRKSSIWVTKSSIFTRPRVIPLAPFRSIGQRERFSLPAISFFMVVLEGQTFWRAIPNY